jgi:hypothetical protein
MVARKAASASSKAPAKRGSATATARRCADALLADLRQLIEQARQAAAVAVNVSLTRLYWRVGKRIRDEVLRHKRADYGERIVASLSRQLAAEYGRGFEGKNLRRRVQFAKAFADEAIVATLSRQLSWSHFRELLPLKRPLQREFYAEMCRIEGWSVRTLASRIDSMLYERTALSRKPEALIRQELAALRAKAELTPALVLKDPHVLDFVGWRTVTWSAISKTPSCASSRSSCSNWERGSRSSRGRSGCRSTARTPTSICSSTTGDCAAWWRWT